MKILVVGDLHGKKSNKDLIEKTLIECNKIAQDVDLTVFLGDMYHEKASIRVEIQSLYVKYLTDWSTDIVIIAGNHDMTNSISCEENSVEILERTVHEKNLISVIKSPVKINDIFFIPYMAELPKLEDADYCFGHLELTGCEYNRIQSTNGFDSKLFDKYKKVIMGHIHQPQEYDNILYVGTPFTQNFGECDDSKRVIIFDTDTNEYENIYLKLPQHVSHTYDITTISEVKDIKKDLKKKVEENHIVRLIINAPEGVKIKREMFDDLVDNLKINYISQALNNKISESLTFEQMSEEYINTIDYSDLDELKELNKQILEDVK